MAYDPTKCAWCNKTLATQNPTALKEGNITKNFCGSGCMKQYLDDKNKG
jgi:hypothetical protein